MHDLCLVNHERGFNQLSKNNVCIIARNWLNIAIKRNKSQCFSEKVGVFSTYIIPAFHPSLLVFRYHMLFFAKSFLLCMDGCSGGPWSIYFNSNTKIVRITLKVIVFLKNKYSSPGGQAENTKGKIHVEPCHSELVTLSEVEGRLRAMNRSTPSNVKWVVVILIS